MINLMGQKFGRLTVIEPTEKRKGGIVWKCVCDCGNKREVSAGILRSGRAISCGCWRRKRTVKHGCSRLGFVTPEYRTWYSMKRRCLNSNNKFYKYYGGRGIIVCDRWLNSFENFLEDMGERPNPELSIDRINNDGNYEPNNCRWATQKEQMAHIRRLKWFIAFNKKTGKTYKSNNQSEFARCHRLHGAGISRCLHSKQDSHKNWRFKFICN